MQLNLYLNGLAVSYLIFDPKAAPGLITSNERTVEEYQRIIKNLSAAGNCLSYYYEDGSKNIHYRLYIDEDPEDRLLEKMKLSISDSLLNIVSGRLIGLKGFLKKPPKIMHIPISRTHVQIEYDDKKLISVPTGCYSLKIYRLGELENDLMEKEFGAHDADIFQNYKGALRFAQFLSTAFVIALVVLFPRHHHTEPWTLSNENQALFFLITLLLLIPYWLFILIVRNTKPVQRVIAESKVVKEKWPDEVIVLKKIDESPKAFTSAIVAQEYSW